jgi:hypothetical protein
MYEHDDHERFDDGVTAGFSVPCPPLSSSNLNLSSSDQSQTGGNNPGMTITGDVASSNIVGASAAAAAAGDDAAAHSQTNLATVASTYTGHEFPQGFDFSALEPRRFKR